MTPNSTKIMNMIETVFTYLRDMLAKVEVSVKDNGMGMYQHPHNRSLF